MKTRGINFGAGPATLPVSILKETQDELLNWKETGMSILEIGHRTPDFMQLLEEAESLLRALLAIPSSYHVLFLGTAARTHFSTIPLNFLNKGQKAGYLLSGVWSSMAYKECKKLNEDPYCIASSEENNFTAVPFFLPANIKENTAYIYYTPNETVNGLCFPSLPQTNNVPLIADMTSYLLSEPININDFGLIFAGAQKNIANAGLTLVIVSDALIQTISNPALPTMTDYRTHIQNKSLYATPPTFNCYLALKMFQWLHAKGGIEKIAQENYLKSHRLYDYIDHSSFYNCIIEKSSRSKVNVCFSTPTNVLDESFVKAASKRGLLSLKGHRLVGGLRASLYNALPLEAVDKLLEFMDDFSRAPK